ncbi:MAG: hypothetical protein KKG06_11330 [Bacteroidetes bacterium]|nr:hypothetical protein [Bacteroidota bacterium]MBU1423744.1 hypothetical protein [Bacteroidota bacterium]
METEKTESKLPPSAELFSKTGLYKQFSIADIDPYLFGYLFPNGPFDLYCLGCKQMSIFRKAKDDKSDGMTVRGPRDPGSPTFADSIIKKKEKEFKHEDRDITIELACSRNTTHRIKYFLRIQSDTLIKIGQYPSLADLQLQGLDKYDGVLDEPQRKEFARAIGLHAHGIGIGAFVYLRRIIENLIEDAHQNALGDPTWNEAVYQNGKTEECIKLLKSHLPELLVSNAGMYAILSKGIHSLTEQECLEYFDTIKVGIELILDEKIEIEHKEQHKKQLTGEIARIHTKLK